MRDKCGLQPRVLGSCTAQQRDRHRGDTRYRTPDPGGGGGSQGVVVLPPLSCSGGRRHCLPGPWSPSPATRAGQGKTPSFSPKRRPRCHRAPDQPAGGRGWRREADPRSPRPRGRGQRDAPGLGHLGVGGQHSGPRTTPRDVLLPGLRQGGRYDVTDTRPGSSANSALRQAIARPGALVSPGGPRTGTERRVFKASISAGALTAFQAEGLRGSTRSGRKTQLRKALVVHVLLKTHLHRGRDGPALRSVHAMAPTPPRDERGDVHETGRPAREIRGTVGTSSGADFSPRGAGEDGCNCK